MDVINECASAAGPLAPAKRISELKHIPLLTARLAPPLESIKERRCRFTTSWNDRKNRHDFYLGIATAQQGERYRLVKEISILLEERDVEHWIPDSVRPPDLPLNPLDWSTEFISALHRVAKVCVGRPVLYKRSIERGRYRCKDFRKDRNGGVIGAADLELAHDLALERMTVFKERNDMRDKMCDTCLQCDCRPGWCSR